MHIRFILTDSLAELQKLSSGRFYTDPEFLSVHYTRVMVIGSNVNFNSLMASINAELDNTLISRDDEITYSLYTHLNFKKYYNCEGYDDFIINEVHPIEDYFIQHEDYAEYIFSRERPMSFSDILPGLKDDQITARRLATGIEVFKNLNHGFSRVNDTIVSDYTMSTSDIIADDWVDGSITLYPTTVKYDSENSMCKIYYDLHDSKRHLPYSELYYFITNGKDTISNDRAKYLQGVPIFIATGIKDKYNFFNNLLNRIMHNTFDLCKLTNVEVFDPSIEFGSPVLDIRTPEGLETYEYSYGRKSAKLIVDTDTVSTTKIEWFNSLLPQSDILYVSFNEML